MKSCSSSIPIPLLGHYYLGRVRAKSKLYLAAEQSYRKALEFNPKSEAVLSDLALVYELEGKTEDAIQTYQRLLRSMRKMFGRAGVWASSTSGKTNWTKRCVNSKPWKGPRSIRARPGSRSA